MFKAATRIILGFGLAAMLAGAPASAQTVWRFSNWVPPTHPLTVEVFNVWAKNVETATKGRVKITFVSALGNPPSHVDLVKDGVADVAMSVNSYTANRFSLSEGVELPFLAPDGMSSCIAYWKTYEKFFTKADEYKADAEGRAELIKLGTTFTTASPEMMKALHAKLDSMTQEWIDKAGKKGVDGKAALAYYVQQVKAAAKK